MVHWRRERQTTSAFLPSEAHEQYEEAKKDTTPEDESPRLAGVQYAYATGGEQTNSSRKNEGARPTWKHSVVKKVQSNMVKNNIA